MPQIDKKEIKEYIEDQQLIQRTEVELETTAPKDDHVENELINFDDKDVVKLTGEVFKLFELLKEDKKDFDGLCEDLECQYKGEMAGDTQIEFNLDSSVTMVKCDSLERLAIKAFIDSDPKFSCKLRPEAMRQGMSMDDIENVQQSQEDYLDYQLDERISIESPLRKVIHQSVKLRGGIMKLPYVFKRKRFVRDEFYSGRKIQDKEGNDIPEGLEGFKANYPTAILEGDVGHRYYKKLLEFKDVNVEAKYWEVTYDDVKPQFVDVKDFFARMTTEGYAGLCDEQIIIERERFTFWDMKKMEEGGELINVDQMQYATDKLSGGATVADHEIKEHEILTCTYWYKPEGEKDEVKIVARFGEHNKVFLGAYEYQYHTVECIYVPFYITDKEKGLFKRGLSEILTQSHLAQNAMLNLMLTEAWQDLVTTPVIREGSSVADQILGGKWKSGVPLVLGSKETLAEELDYVPKSQRNVAGQLINLLMFLGRSDDMRTGISALASGQETPMDPNAPAAKVAMLMKQSGINIEEYINCLLPSFNKVGEIILKITHQMSNSGRKYRGRQRAKRVTGQDPFKTISRDDMILETVIESRAAGFAFDKIQEKNENLAFYQLMRQEPIIARNPEAVHEMVKSLCKSWNPMWKAKVDKIVLTDGQFNQEILKVGVQALTMYMKQMQEQAKTTGGQPNANIKDFLSMATQMISQTINPEEKEKKANV